MGRRFTLFVGILLFSRIAFAQHDIEPKLIFSDTSSFVFTGEWQYLSTEIYLFNGEKFSNLINEIDFQSTKPKKGNSPPQRYFRGVPGIPLYYCKP